MYMNNRNVEDDEDIEVEKLSKSNDRIKNFIFLSLLSVSGLAKLSMKIPIIV
jgi:hypothetical protein